MIKKIEIDRKFNYQAVDEALLSKFPLLKQAQMSVLNLLASVEEDINQIILKYKPDISRVLADNLAVVQNVVATTQNNAEEFELEYVRYVS